MQIEKSIVGGRGVHFEVAGMDQHPERSMDGECDAIHHAMRNLDRMNGERSQLESLARLDLVHLCVIEQAVFFQLALDERQRELGPVDGDVQLGEDPRQSANVIFVRVGEDDAANLLAILEQVSDVGNNDVHAQQFGFGEHEPGVDDDDLVSPANGHAVHSELAKATKGDYVKFAARHTYYYTVSSIPADVKPCSGRACKAVDKQGTPVSSGYTF